MTINAKPVCTIVAGSERFHVVDIGRVEYTAQLPDAKGLASQSIRSHNRTLGRSIRNGAV